MAEESLITDEMRKDVGKLVNIAVTEMERGAIRSFCNATGDENPLWQDEDYARGTIHGGTIVPPGYLITMGMEGDSPGVYLTAQHALRGGIDAGGEWQFFRQVRIGDVITVDRRFVDLYEKRGSLGPMIFAIMETVYRNQRGEIVARGKWSGIRVPAPEVKDWAGVKDEDLAKVRTGRED